MMPARLTPLVRGRHSCSYELFHLAHDFVLLRVGQLRKHREGNDLSGDAFSDRQVSGLVPQVFVGPLSVQRNWIVYAGSDSRFCEVRLKRFAILHAHDIQVVDTLGPCGFSGNGDPFLQF